MKFKYRSTHFPTGTVTETECECMNEMDFLRFLNQWNHVGGGSYLYVGLNISRGSAAAHDFKSSVMVSHERSAKSVADAGGYWTEYG